MVLADTPTLGLMALPGPAKIIEVEPIVEPVIAPEPAPAEPATPEPEKVPA